jgi:cytoskeletal protein RodZ
VIFCDQAVGTEVSIMTVGARLRQAREARNMSIESLARATRVQPRLLEAIERDAVSLLPPRPYNRGLVRAYAREIGLDPHETVREYFADVDALPPQNVPTPAPAPFDDTPSPLRSALIIIAVMAGLAVGVNWMRSAEQPRQPKAVGTSGTAVPVPASTTAPPASAPNPVPVLPSMPALTIILEPTQPSWMSATTDGQRVVYRILQPGEKLTLRATRDISMRVGDAGAVTWSVNGRPLGMMGARGAVRDVTVTPSTASTVR